ncbi:MAG: transketolase [Selenomonadaceae bacterium]|nr:transketolase [Selenomonadaceae bacterium]
MMDMREVCRLMRIDCLKMAEAAGNFGMHFGGSLSLIEIVAALYLGYMKINRDYFLNETRNRVIISKGHGVPAVYAALHQAGIISDEELATFKADDTMLYGHPSLNKELGIEFSSGSLGQGLSLGVGVALALRHKNNTSSRVFVILGDGELDEGSVWEAAMSANKYNLSNLVAVVDYNRLQYDGDVAEIMPLEPISDKWKSFGWQTIDIDGHDVDKCLEVFKERYDQPTAIIAHTVKGKGISFVENNFIWHHKKMTRNQFDLAYEELRK